MMPVVIKVAASSLADKLQSAKEKPELNGVDSKPEILNMVKKVMGNDEECYEDEGGHIKMCKKCAKKSQNFTGNHNKYNMQERINLVNFLKQLNEKNYVEAHKYLKKIMEAKLANRIAKNKNMRLF